MPKILAGMNPAISRLAGRLRDAETITPELFSEIIRDACWRLPSVRRTKDFDRLGQLIQSCAWTDAALALLALEIPQWRLRQIVYDSGEWQCTLSRQCELPDWLDEPVEACHPDRCLAILIALVHARGDGTPAAEYGATNSSRVDCPIDMPLCCDNFS
jgi:hypothetical protein